MRSALGTLAMSRSTMELVPLAIKCGYFIAYKSSDDEEVNRG